MNNREIIVNELKELSPVLAQSSRSVPYQVPMGYFEELPEKILGLVHSVNNGSPILEKAKQNPFNVPSGYFENLADSILERIKAIEIGSPKDEIQALSPLLGKLDNKNLYHVPAGYFDELAGNVTDGAKAIELVNEALENLSPLMNSLKQKNVYEVPTGYFESLPSEVLTKAKQQHPSKVISISFSRKIMRYAAAAVVAGVIVTSGWLYFKDPIVSPNPDVDVATKEVTKELRTTSDEELLRFIETENNLTDETVTTSPSTEEIEATDMKDMLVDVTDEELQQYIEETSPENDNSVTN